jgi:rod shape-determining protein MreC
VAAKVIGRSPSPWVKTIMIDKGTDNGLTRGLPVMVSEGIVGQVIAVSDRYSRVLLVTDRNSAVDALVQSSRARGIVKGNNTDECSFCYALRKDEIQAGEMIVSSGLDGVFSKGLRIGQVVDVKKESSELFQTILLKTCVDFDRLEEVLVSIRPETAAGRDA